METWIAGVTGQGWLVSTGTKTAAGWPFKVALVVERPALSGGWRYLPGGVGWSADRAVISVSLLHPLTLRVNPEGQQFLRLSHLPDLAFTAMRTTFQLGLASNRGQGRFDATAVSGGIAGSRHPQDVQVAALSAEVRQDQNALRGTQVWLDVRASGVGLPDIGRWPLGATVANVGASLQVVSPKLPDVQRTQERGTEQAILWRDGGGRVTLQDGVLRWGPLKVRISATLNLDDRLQPAGTGTADLAGAPEALDAAAEGGLISPGMALTIKAVLAVMPRTPGSAAVRLPFLLQNSTLSVGRIPVARLPDANWQTTENP